MRLWESTNRSGLRSLSHRILATAGTAQALERNGVRVDVLRKQREGRGPSGEPTTVDAIMAGEIDLIVNTPYGVGPRVDGYEIRTAAVIKGVPSITTVQGLAAAVQGIESLRSVEPTVHSLQEHGSTLKQLRSVQAASIRSGHQSRAAMHPQSAEER